MGYMNSAKLYSAARGQERGGLYDVRMLLVSARPEAINTFEEREVREIMSYLKIRDPAAYYRALSKLRNSQYLE